MNVTTADLNYWRKLIDWLEKNLGPTCLVWEIKITPWTGLPRHNYRAKIKYTCTKQKAAAGGEFDLVHQDDCNWVLAPKSLK
jgi:hypothetical protein